MISEPHLKHFLLFNIQVLPPQKSMRNSILSLKMILILPRGIQIWMKYIHSINTLAAKPPQQSQPRLCPWAGRHVPSIPSSSGCVCLTKAGCACSQGWLMSLLCPPNPLGSSTLRWWGPSARKTTGKATETHQCIWNYLLLSAGNILMVFVT